jgi:hypothetical protein
VQFVILSISDGYEVEAAGSGIQELVLLTLLSHPLHFAFINPTEWIFYLIRKRILSNLPVG